MPKLTGPLSSLRASGTIAKLLSFTRRRKQNIVELKPIPKDALSPAQLAWRPMFLKCVDLWHTLTEAEKKTWERAATPRHMTGYAWFMSQCLGPNPGIYLPLAGGTMTGAIAMSTKKITGMGDPTDPQDADTKAGRDGAILTHKGDASAHHTAFTPTDHQADAHNMTLDGVDLSAHAANADAHHAKQHALSSDPTNHTGRAALSQLPDGTLGKVLTAQGVGVDPIYATISPGMTFTNYYYSANLAAAAYYTPPAKAITTLLIYTGKIQSTYIHLEFWDGTGWQDAAPTTPVDSHMALMQDTAQSIRIHNGFTSAWKFSLTGVTWS